MGRMIRMRWPGMRQRALTLSYDDGRMEDFRLAELMKQNSVKGAFNINSRSFYPENGPEKDSNRRRMTRSEFLKFAEQYKDLAEIAVHTCTHPSLTGLSSGQVVEEVVEDRAEIEEMLGTICRGMAYPYGHTNDQVVAALEACGIAYSRTTKKTLGFAVPTDWLRLPATCHHNEPTLFELAEDFLREREDKYSAFPMLFYLWGHSYEFENDGNWDRIEEFLSKVGGREDVWYATNIEIYDYVKAFESLRWSVRGTRVYNPTTTDVCFQIYTSAKSSGRRVTVPAGETVVL